MNLNTTSGLHGQIVAYVQIEKLLPSGTIVAVAIVKREDPAFESRPYSTHRVYETVSAFDGTSTFVSEAGHYDLTYDEARVDLMDRVGWPSGV